MTVLKILQYPNPRLRTKAKQVEKIDERIKKIIDDMFETHYNAHNCAALAATQLDIIDPPRITVIDFSPERNQPLCLINPVITFKTGEMIEEEGCMSVGIGSSIYEKVKRAENIHVKALDEEGNILEFDAEGFMAKCLQHEIDHLNGILYIDHLSRLKKNRLEKKLQKIHHCNDPTHDHDHDH
jgi:peptide deformylase